MTMTSSGPISVSETITTTNKPGRDPVLIGLWIALIIVALVWFAPFVFIVFTSLKTKAAVTSTGAFMPPVEFAFENYASAWSRGNFAESFMNSVIITVFKVPL